MGISSTDIEYEAAAAALAHLKAPHEGAYVNIIEMTSVIIIHLCGNHGKVIVPLFDETSK